MLARFLSQENKDYRNMQIVFSLLTLNFLIPSLSYFFTPELAIQQFRALGAMLGGPEYPLTEESYLWRVLGAGNVFTLSFICLLLQLNVRRFPAAAPIFVVLKGFSALGFLYVYLVYIPYRVFLATFLWDGLAVFLVLRFGSRAFRSVLASSPEQEAALVPRLHYSRLRS